MDKLTVGEKQNVKYAIPLWLRDEQIRYAIQKVKGRLQPNLQNKIEEPIAIVGFGPSLKKTWEQIKDFKIIMTCSGAHRYLIDRGIIPKYHVEVDPRDHKVELLGKPHNDVEYLIASTCAPQYFDNLDGYNVKLWHVFDSTDDGIRLLPQGEWAVTGGCDVGMRCLTLASAMGYRNFHIFGLDGCAENENGERHAAYHPNGKKKYYEVDYNGKKYYTTQAMLEATRQILHELDQLPVIKYKFYGEGLTQELVKNHVRPSEGVKFENIVGFGKPLLITDEYAALNKQLHKENVLYGVGGKKHVEMVMKLAEVLKTNKILDYGCGKGLLGRSLPYPIWEYDPAIEGKNESPRSADLVVCTDVLEHIEPELLSNVLYDLKRCVDRVGYFVIHTGPAKKTLPDGRNTHLIQKDKDWWVDTLGKFFKIGTVKENGPELQIVVGPTEDEEQDIITANEHKD